ncbi:sugar ABC transporter substrate-binding protein [Actinokineospora sp.]|uniref:sugar ABC transporter substrate-binding protein n=1 Tax=Actinokineospora sp. TaxID=1872133 RepID=UPI0040379892
MARLHREPTFLPLTLATAHSLSRAPGSGLGDHMVHISALRVDAAAAECWAALLAGCDAPGRHLLPARLRELSAAASAYAGESWWHGDGAYHRGRIEQARVTIEEAVAERDGAEFAEAFVGYDQAVATALVRVRNRVRSPAG